MPEYKSNPDWYGLKIHTRDANRWRRCVFSLRNYYILDVPAIVIDVTRTKDSNKEFPEITFEQSARQGTVMYPLKNFTPTQIEGGYRYEISGRRVKEREDYRIDIVSALKHVGHKEVVFQTSVLSKDVGRRDKALILWGALLGGAVGMIGTIIVGVLLGLIQVVPAWQLSL